MYFIGTPTACLDTFIRQLENIKIQQFVHVQLIFGGPFRDKDEMVKISYLLIRIGDKGRDVHNTWTLTNEKKKKLDMYYKAYVQPTLTPVLNNEVQGQQPI